MKISTLGYALLGLVTAKPETGYALRKVFESTPLGKFSSSPGSIYPALGKLIKGGLLEIHPPKEGGKNLHHITHEGNLALEDWLKAPVTIDEVAKNVEHVLLRFAFLQSIDSISVTRLFLQSFETAFSNHLNHLKNFMTTAEGTALSRHGRLAMENDIRVFEAHLAWSIDAQKEFTS